MPVFQEMDPEIALRLIEGYEDEISPAVEKSNVFYRRFRCPRCQSQMEKEYNIHTAFTGDSVLPKALLRCPTCNLLYDPHSDLIVESGNAAKAVPYGIIPLGK